MDDDMRRSPLVVVTRRGRPGTDPAMARWLEDLSAAARDQPGFTSLMVDPPTADEPGTWRVTYQFRDAASLDAWLGSRARQPLVDAGAPLLVSPPVEQRIAVTLDAPVTAVSSVRVPEAHREAYRERHDEVLSALSQAPGFVSAELLEPVAGVQDDTAVVLSFASRADLEGWLESDARRKLLDELAPLVAGPRQVSLIGGFVGWFTGAADPSPVPRWKQALVILLALYPTAMVIGTIQRMMAPGLHVALATFIGNALGVAVLTWALIPWLTRLLDRWLRR